MEENFSSEELNKKRLSRPNSQVKIHPELISPHKYENKSVRAKTELFL